MFSHGQEHSTSILQEFAVGIMKAQSVCQLFIHSLSGSLTSARECARIL